MTTAKTTTLTFRVEPELGKALPAVAERGHRSIVNLVEGLIIGSRGRNDIPIELDPVAGRNGAAR